MLQVGDFVCDVEEANAADIGLDLSAVDTTMVVPSSVLSQDFLS